MISLFIRCKVFLLQNRTVISEQKEEQETTPKLIFKNTLNVINNICVKTAVIRLDGILH